jgi:hypothetical protein
MSGQSPVLGRASRPPLFNPRRCSRASAKRGPVPSALHRSASTTVWPALLLLALSCGCSTTPRVLEVSSRTRLQTVDKADMDLFVNDQASRIKYVPEDLSIADQREEFYVHWNPGPTSRPGPTFRPGPATVNLVKFEYRQVAKPNTIFEQTYDPHGETAHLFQVRGEEFRSGGSVSAWRVSLWNGNQLLAEKKSVLW